MFGKKFIQYIQGVVMICVGLLSFAGTALADDLSGFELVTTLRAPVTASSYAYNEEVIFDGDWQLPPHYTLELRFKVDGDVIHTILLTNTSDFATTSSFYESVGSVLSGEDWNTSGSHDASMAMYAVDLDSADTTFQTGEVREYTLGLAPVPNLNSTIAAADGLLSFSVLEGGTDTSGQQGVTVTTPLVISNPGDNTTTVTGNLTLTAGVSGHLGMRYVGDTDWEVILPFSIIGTNSKTVEFLHTAGVGDGTVGGFLQFNCDNCDDDPPSTVVVSTQALEPAAPAIEVRVVADSKLLSAAPYSGTLDFGLQGIGLGAVTKTLQLKNTGGQDVLGTVTYTNISGAAQYSCSPDCTYGPITPGSTENIDITFNPAIAVVDTETMTFNVTSGTNRNFTVTGEGTADPRMKITASYDPSSPTPPVWDFGGETFDLAIDMVQIFSYTISNHGPFPLYGTTTLTGNAAYTCTSGCGGYGPIIPVAAGGSNHVVTIQFDPSSGGTIDAIVSFISNDPYYPYVPGPLNYDVPLSVEVSETTELEVTSDYTATGGDITTPAEDWEYDPFVNLGDTRVLTFRLENIQAGVMNGTTTFAGGSDTDYTITAGAVFTGLKNGDTAHTVTVSVTPSDADVPIEATLVFTTDSGDVYEVDLKLNNVNENAILLRTVLLDDFSNVLIGDSKTREVVEFENVGVATNTVVGTFTDESFFSCVSPVNCTCVLGPGVTCRMEVTFDATSTLAEVLDTPKSALMTWTNITAASFVNRTMNGVVIYPHMEVVPTATTDFGSITVGEILPMGGTAVRVGGPSGYVNVVNDAALNMQFPFTIAGWIRNDSVPNGVGDFRTIIGKYNFSGEQRSWHFGIDTSNNLRFWKTSDGKWSTAEGRSVNINADSSIGEWIHVAVSIDAAGVPAFYSDGVARGTGGGAFVASHVFEGSSPATIGSIYNSAGIPDMNFQGDIDDLRVYDRALVQAEIIALAEPPAGRNHNAWGLTHHWTFDSTGTDFAGTMTATPSGGASYVEAGTLYVRNTGLTNTGDNYLTYTNDIDISFLESPSTIFNCFGVCSGPVTLAPVILGVGSGWTTETIEFNPGSLPGTWTEDMAVSYVSPSTGLGQTVTREMTGEATAIPLIHVESSLVASSPPGPWLLGDQNINATSTIEYYVSNVGTGVLTGHATGTIPVSPLSTENAPFSCIQNCTYTLAAGESTTTIMQFVTAIGGGKNTYLVFTNDADTFDRIYIEMTANVNDSPILTAAPQPASLGTNFGTLAVATSGDMLSAEFKISNVGAGVFTGRIVDSGPFKCLVNCTGLTIVAGAHIISTIAFEPGTSVVSEGYYTDIPIDIEYVGGALDGATAATLELSGRAYMVRDMEVTVGGVNVEGTLYDYGNILAGDIRDEDFVISNNALGQIRGETSILYQSLENPFDCISCFYSGVDVANTATVTMKFVPVVENDYFTKGGFSGQTNPVAYYPFDNADFNVLEFGASNITKDRSGNNLDSTAFTGIPTTTGPWVPSNFEEAMNFSGINRYISIPDNALLDPDEISISVWIKQTAANTGNIISKGANSGYRLRVSNSGQIVFHDRGATNQLTSAAVVTSGTWQHVVVTGGIHGLEIYLNGTRIASSTTSYGSPNTASALQIGAEPLYGEYFNGAIDEVLIYDRVLSQGEITMLHNDSDKIRLTGLRGHRSFVSVINVTFGAVDFGNVKVEEYVDKIFKLKNDGSGNFAGDLLLTTGQPFTCLYSISDAICDPDTDADQCTTVADADKDYGCSYDISGGGFFTAFIRFAPISRGEFRSDVSFTTITGVEIPLTGFGYIPGFTFEEQ